METSFCELKGKEVINVVDGKRLGKIIDIVFDTHYGKVLGIVVPAYDKSWNIFKACDDIFIPFNCICKFGEDAILVQIYVPVTNQKQNRKGKFIKTATAQSVNINQVSLQNNNVNEQKETDVHSAQISPQQNPQDNINQNGYVYNQTNQNNPTVNNYDNSSLYP